MYVVGALLSGQPELRLLTDALPATTRLELIDDRLAVVSTVVTARPGAVVLPPFDRSHISTAPLVLRLRRESPGVAVLILAASPAGAGQPILRAVLAGAHALTCPTVGELRETLNSLLAR